MQTYRPNQPITLAITAGILQSRDAASECRPNMPTSDLIYTARGKYALVNCVILSGYFDTHYENDEIPIPESWMPPDSTGSEEGAIFCWNVDHNNAYSIRTSAVRRSRTEEIEGEKNYLVKKTDARFYDAAKFSESFKASNEPKSIYADL